MKAYTDLEQSKKLAEILPLESADMRFCYSHTLDGRITGHYPMIGREPSMGTTPCWSLAALLDLLSKTAHSMNENASVDLSSYKTTEWDLGIDNSDLELVTESNPVDACVELIIKLKEQNLL